MKKIKKLTDFQKLDILVKEDIETKSENVKATYGFLSAELVKQGGKLTIGVDTKAFEGIMNDEKLVATYIIDKKSFYSIKAFEETEEMCGVCIGCNNSGMRHCAHADTCGSSYTIPVRLYEHLVNFGYQKAVNEINKPTNS